MISSLIKFIIYVIVCFLFLVTLLTIFTKTVILNESYYAYSLKKSGVYKIYAQSARGAVSEFAMLQLSEAEGYENLSIDEKEQMSGQIESFASFIDESIIQIVIENNIRNALGYLNGKTQNLVLYLPINELNLPEEITNQIPEDYKSQSDYNAADILTASGYGTPSNLRILKSLNSTSRFVNLSLLGLFAAQILAILLYLLISRHQQRFQAMGKLLSLVGVFVLIFSWILHTGINLVITKTNWNTVWAKAAFDATIPLFSRPLVYIFSACGLTTFILGLLLFNKNPKKDLVTTPKFK